MLFIRNQYRDLVAGRGRKREELAGTGTAADAGTRRGAQGRTAEAGGWQMQAATRWEALCTGRGGWEQVKLEVFDYEHLRMGR